MSYRLAEKLESESRCDYCWSLIKNHNTVEALLCLQELSKSHKEFRENYVDDIRKVTEALNNV